MGVLVERPLCSTSICANKRAYDRRYRRENIMSRHRDRAYYANRRYGSPKLIAADVAAIFGVPSAQTASEFNVSVSASAPLPSQLVARDGIMVPSSSIATRRS